MLWRRLLLLLLLLNRRPLSLELQIGLRHSHQRIEVSLKVLILLDLSQELAGLLAHQLPYPLHLRPQVFQIIFDFFNLLEGFFFGAVFEILWDQWLVNGAELEVLVV